MGFGQTSWDDLSLGRRPIIDSSEFQFLDYDHASDPACHNGQARVESIIMPTANKRFFNQTSLGREWEGFWNTIWHQAGESLGDSSEVYLIGYSIPEYDSRARDLLAKRVSKTATVRVCCHNSTPGVVESLRHLVHLKATDIQADRATTFEGWVSTMGLDCSAIQQS
jgi:hypothetical protein